jgi:hypothetical protein
VVGKISGGMIFLEQTGKKGEFKFTAKTGIFENLQTGNYSVPSLFDLNHDGLTDLITGSKSGYFDYFENTGNKTNPIFFASPTIPRIGNVETIDEKTSNHGYSAPCIVEHGGETFLFSGCETGKFFMWRLPENRLTDDFILSDSSVADTDEGAFSSLSLADINSDGLPDMITGNKRGGISFYKSSKYNISQNIHEIKGYVYPNPTCGKIWFKDFDITGDSEIYLTDLSGRRLFQCRENIFSGKTFVLDWLASGIYIMDVQNTSKRFLFRIIKN